MFLLGFFFSRKPKTNGGQLHNTRYTCKMHLYDRPVWCAYTMHLHDAPTRKVKTKRKELERNTYLSSFVSFSLILPALIWYGDLDCEYRRTHTLKMKKKKMNIRYTYHYKKNHYSVIKFLRAKITW